MKNIGKYLLLTALTAFALLTLFLSSSVILDLFGIREKEGNYVLFIVWANFLSSFLYLFAAYGLFTLEKWTVKILLSAGTVLTVAQIGLFLYINSGGIYEEKTVKAMFFRITLTLVFALFSYFVLRKKKQSIK